MVQVVPRWAPEASKQSTAPLALIHSHKAYDAMLLYAAALHVSIATPIRCHLRTAASAQLNLIA